jgi:hypothetical protein
MNKMILGGVTFTYNSKIDFPVIKPKKANAHVETYSGVAYFSWTPTIKGIVIPLKWDWMPAAQFNSIEALYQADDVIVFDPSGGVAGAAIYDVIIIKFDGVYWLNMDTNNSYREKVEMELLVFGQSTNPMP